MQRYETLVTMVDPIEAEKVEWMMLKRGDEGGVEITLGPGKIVPDVVAQVMERCEGKPALAYLELSEDKMEIESPEDIPYEELRKLSSHFGPVLHFKTSIRDAAYLYRHIEKDLLSKQFPEILEGTDEEFASWLDTVLTSDRDEFLRRFKGMESADLGVE